MTETPPRPRGTEAGPESAEASPAQIPSRAAASRRAAARRGRRNDGEEGATSAVILPFEPKTAIDRSAFRRAQDKLIAGEISDEAFLTVWRLHLRHEGRERHFEILKALYLTAQALSHEASKR